MANVNRFEPKSVKVWENGRYFVEKTPELEAEVEKVIKLWEESDSLKGYCSQKRRAKLYEYKSDDYKITTVAEHYGVTCVCLWKKQ